MSSPSETVAAVVLAAGGGTRWDGDGHKLLAPVNGRPLAAHALDAAAAADLDEMVVVVGAVDLEAAGVVPAGATVLANGRWAEGQAASLRLAVAHARSQGHAAVVVGLADSPGVPVEAWRAVAVAPSPLAVATFGGRRRPPTRIAQELWDDLPNDGDVGARSLLSQRADLVLEVACPGDPADVDVLEDLRRWS
ncbi:MAG: NTP transferase domain-containing protein [Actinomycetota bacterium]|nr:NTP transferase domain-containing protein [Actinomycetota bacterium]